MIIFYKKEVIRLFFVLILTVLEINILIFRKSEYIFISTIYAKNQTHYQFDLNHKIQKLTQFYDAHSQCLIQLQQQLSENQQDIDILRGNIQDIQHHISEIMHKQNEICNKLNHVLQENNLQLSSNNTKQLPICNNKAINIESHDLSKHERSDNDSSAVDYRMAVALVLEKKQYAQAIQAFQDFIKNHPKSHYQPNAYYWLGQLYYNQGKKNDASYYFAWVVKNYPKSLKASDALLKIGIIMQETNQQDKAKTIYRQIDKLYPNSDSAKQAKKRLERL